MNKKKKELTHRGQVAEGVVGAGGSRDTGGVLSGRPLANMVGKLALVSDLGGPPVQHVILMST